MTLTTQTAPSAPVGGTGFTARVKRHTGQIMLLSGPIIVSNVAIMTMEIVDTLMVGHFDTIELAYQGIASAVLFPMLVCGIGFMQGTQIAVSNAFGAGDLKRCGECLRLSIPYAIFFGLLGTLICLAGEPVLRLLGQEADIARGGGEVVRILGLGLPAILIAVACAGFLDGLGRPMAGMIVILVANLVNAFGNWVLVYGNFGAPAMGATGSAWATVAVRWMMIPAIILCIALLVDRRAFGLDQLGDRLSRMVSADAFRWLWRQSAFQRKIGFAFATGFFVEAFAFEALTIYAGWIGAEEIAAYTIAFRTLGVIFMVSLGIAVATGVRVGIANGRNDKRDVAIAGWVGMGINFFIAAFVGVVVALNAEAIASLFSRDEMLIILATPAIVLCGVMIVFDGGQVVAVRALRSRGDAWIPTILHAVSYIGIMLPLTWYLALPLGRGLPGLFEGAIIASIVAVSLQMLRFAWLSRSDRHQEGRLDPA